LPAVTKGKTFRCCSACCYNEVAVALLPQEEEATLLPQLAAVLNAETQLQLGIQFEAAKVRGKTRISLDHCISFCQ
jgi:hypothetical protein